MAAMKKLFSLMLALLLMLGLSLTAFAHTATVTGEGSTREDALHDAFRKAVEDTLGIYVQGETQVTNYRVTRDEILARSQGYVRNYDVLSERVTGVPPQARHELLVKVDVDDTPNSNLLNALKIIPLTGNPRIAVVISEQQVGSYVADHAAETGVLNALTTAGFTRVVDQKQIDKIRQGHNLAAAYGGDRTQLLHDLNTQGVDYLVLGEAFSETATRLADSDVLAARARVDVKLVKADTGEILGAQGLYASGIDTSAVIAGKKAIEKASESAGKFVAGLLLNSGSNTVKGIQLQVQARSFDQVSTLVQALKAIPGMQNVYTRDYASGLATLDLDYSGTQNSLLDGLRQQYRGGFTVLAQSGSLLKLQL